jgi:hypothetical protein
MNNLLSNAEGLSANIQSIQEEMYAFLSTRWSGDIEGYGKVSKNIDNTSEEVPKYYKTSRIFIPEVYSATQKDYIDVYYDDNKSCVFCFLVGDRDTSTDEVLFTTRAKAVFLVDLTKIYPNDTERQDSKAQKDAIEGLRTINGDYKITGVEKGINTVFNDYMTANIKFDDMQPLHCFAVTLDLNYYLTDKCT